jgi:hypothetical protein
MRASPRLKSNGKSGPTGIRNKFLDFMRRIAVDVACTDGAFPSRCHRTERRLSFVRTTGGTQDYCNGVTNTAERQLLFPKPAGDVPNVPFRAIDR